MKLMRVDEDLLALGDLHLEFADDLGLRHFTQTTPVCEVLDVPSFE